MNKIRPFGWITVIAMLVLALASCTATEGELKDTTGYTPVKACIEKVIPYSVMRKGMVSVKVSYLVTPSLIDTTTVYLGRESESLFHKGDTLQFYVHPAHPKELRFKRSELFIMKPRSWKS